MIPLYIHVTKQAVQIEQEIEATHLLYERIQRYLLEGVRENSLIERKNEYHIVWNEGENYSLSEVCIYYQDVFDETIQKCESLEE